MGFMTRIARCLILVEKCADVTIRLSGPCYVAAATTLMLAVMYTFLHTLLPLRYPLTSPQGIMHLIWASWAISNIFFNYYNCVFNDPGRPTDSEEWRAVLQEAGEGPHMKWCRKCKAPKPPLSHHCHICNRCILRMDHHCPWMANCVGLKNYRYFFLFIFWLWCSCIYAASMSTPLFKQRVRGTDGAGLLFTFVLTVAVSVSLSCLMFWHIYLILTGQSTIEFYNNRRLKQQAKEQGEEWVNIYDLGYAKNWQEAFDERGKFWWFKWLLPRVPPAHFSDGMCHNSIYGPRATGALHVTTPSVNPLHRPRKSAANT